MNQMSELSNLYPPAEIVDAAEKVRIWMDSNGHKNWQLGGICDRRILSKPLSTGMRECYAAFMLLYPWRKNELPTYEAWILSDDYAALIFRQGWAARAGKDW